MRSTIFAALLLLVASITLAHADSPAWCLAQGNCTAPAPICDEEVQYFWCQADGTWFSNYTVLNQSLTIGGPVYFNGSLELLDEANITFTSAHSAVLTVAGLANFTSSNPKWTVEVSQADIDAYYAQEKVHSTDYTNTTRRIFISNSYKVPSDWSIALSSPITCHIPYLANGSVNWDLVTSGGTVWQAINLQFYTASECWYWIILIGAILFYFAVVVIVIVVMRTVPSLVQWTTQPTFNSAGSGSGAYELDYKPNNKSRSTVELDEVH